MSGILFNLASILLIVSPQYANPDEWRSMAARSPLIIRGTIESESMLVRKDKITATSTPLPDGRLELHLPRAEDYMVGRLFRLRIDEVIKRSSRSRLPRFVEVFVPGIFATHADPNLIPGREYVVFLSPFERGTDSYTRYAVQRLEGGVARRYQFHPASSYNIVGGNKAAVDLTGADRVLLQQVKVAVALASQTREQK